MAMKPIDARQTSGRDANGVVRRGRKPLDVMNPQFVEPLIGYLEEGMGFRASCDLLGVSPTSVRKYVREGMQDLYAGRESQLAEFAYQVNSAMAEAKRTRIIQINQAAKNPMLWQAAAWFLERTYPQDFGRQDRLAMTLSGGLGIASVNVEVSDEEADAIAAFLQRNRNDEEGSGDQEPASYGGFDESDDYPVS